MEKIPYRIPEYHKMIWKEANKEAKKIIFSDMRVVLGELILAVVSASITSRALEIWSGVANIPTAINVITIALGALVGFIALYIFRLITNGLLIMPAVFYRERETEAWKFTWNDIEIKPFLFPPSFGENAVGLEITSYKNRNVYEGTSREFSIAINKLLLEEVTKGTITVNPRRDLHFLATDLIRFHETTGIENQREKNIEGNWKHRVVLVAQWDDKEAWIVTKDKTKDLLIEKGKPVGIIITIDSSLEDKEMIGIAVHCTLRYIENKNGKMVVDIEITKRK